MKKIQGYLKNINYMKCCLWMAVIADIIYLFNAVWSIIRYFRLDVSETEGQYLKERGIIEYVWEHHSQQIMFKIGLAFLVMAVIAIFVSYLLNKEGKRKIVMAVCLGVIVIASVVLIILNMSILIHWRIDSIDVVTELTAIILLSLAVLITFVIFVMDREYRKTILILLGSGGWFALGVVLMTLAVVGVITVIILKVISFFTDSSSGTTILEEKDEYGNVIRRWREDQ